MLQELLRELEAERRQRGTACDSEAKTMCCKTNEVWTPRTLQ